LRLVTFDPSVWKMDTPAPGISLTTVSVISNSSKKKPDNPIPLPTTIEAEPSDEAGFTTAVKIRLCGLVQARPIIWSLLHPDHRKPAALNSEWKNIGKELNIPGK